MMTPTQLHKKDCPGDVFRLTICFCHRPWDDSRSWNESTGSTRSPTKCVLAKLKQANE